MSPYFFFGIIVAIISSQLSVICLKSIVKRYKNKSAELQNEWEQISNEFFALELDIEKHKDIDCEACIKDNAENCPKAGLGNRFDDIKFRYEQHKLKVARFEASFKVFERYWSPLDKLLSFFGNYDSSPKGGRS